MSKADPQAPLPGDSAEQQRAQALMLREFGDRLGVRLDKRKFSLQNGGWLEVSGVSDSPPLLCEAWAHQGPARSAQKHKVMTDAAKLLHAAKLMPSLPRLILLFADEAATSHLRGRSWMGAFLEDNGIEVEVVRLPDDVLASIRAAQRRQFR